MRAHDSRRKFDVLTSCCPCLHHALSRDTAKAASIAAAGTDTQAHARLPLEAPLGPMVAALASTYRGTAGALVFAMRHQPYVTYILVDCINSFYKQVSACNKYDVARVHIECGLIAQMRS